MAGTKNRSGGPRNVLPLETKRLRGTARKGREVPNVPAPDYAKPEAPDYLSERARELWRDFVRWLGPDGRNVLTESDGPALAAMATAFADFEEKPSASLHAQLRGWVALFGLSPADRQRIPAVAKPEPGRRVIRPRVR